MKTMYIKTVIAWALVLLAVIALSASCRTQRTSTTTSVNIDSIRNYIVDSAAGAISEQWSMHEAELKESLGNRVEFVIDSTPCPPVDCDSAELEHYRQVSLSLQNKVKYYKDGSIEYSGQIKSAEMKADRYSKELDSVGMRNEWFVRQHLADSAALHQALTNSTTKMTRTLYVIPWFIWLIIAALGIIMLLKKKRSVNPFDWFSN